MIVLTAWPACASVDRSVDGTVIYRLSDAQIAAILDRKVRERLAKPASPAARGDRLGPTERTAAAAIGYAGGLLASGKTAHLGCGSALGCRGAANGYREQLDVVRP